MRVLEFKRSRISVSKLQSVLNTVQFSGSAAGQILYLEGTSRFYYVNTSKECLEAILRTLGQKGISYRKLNYPTNDVHPEYKEILSAARRTRNYC